MGAARAWLERELTRDVGEAFIYESRVAPLREGRRNPSVPAAQMFLGLWVLATAIVGFWIAAEQRALILVVYTVLTAFALVVAVLAVIDLRRTYAAAAAEFGADAPHERVIDDVPPEPTEGGG
jgi:hypothetical protein